MTDINSRSEMRRVGLQSPEKMLQEIERLRAALKLIDETLRVPAAEYVPAIQDVFLIIDKVKHE